MKIYVKETKTSSMFITTKQGKESKKGDGGKKRKKKGRGRSHLNMNFFSLYITQTLTD